jgi:TM2 domain-containing membrane protein YozV
VAKSVEKKPAAEPQGDVLHVDLKDRHFAAFLSWLVPGAGQFYQGRRGKAGLFFVCVLGIFVWGLVLGEGRVVYAQWEPAQFRRYSYLGQVWVGLPSLPALVGAARQNNGHESLPLLGERWYMPPRTDDAVYDIQGNVVEPNELDRLNRDLNRRFELGTVFTLIAGLLNVLVIYDAWSGPAYSVMRKKEEKDEVARPPDDNKPGEV